MASTVEINDAVFCSEHMLEVCDDCNFDGREENDAFHGFDPIDRESLDASATTMDKDGVLVCNQHGSSSCSQCHSWKKQITRLRVKAKKAN
ncbi:hypothetical protein RhiLY_12757 [Ceratobasidium sp. AG-Ba]|nr:hypothetical protein RhiLY_12757 [Ceratobasidium sp. AG-Ba]